MTRCTSSTDRTSASAEARASSAAEADAFLLNMVDTRKANAVARIQAALLGEPEDDSSEDDVVTTVAATAEVVASAEAATPATPSAIIDEHIRAAFGQFDADGSGGLDVSELMPALKMLGHQTSDESVQQVLDKYSSDGKTLSLHDFSNIVEAFEETYSRGAAGLTLIRKTPLAMTQVDVAVRATFEATDTSGDGQIDADELLVALSKLGMEATPEQARKVLQKYDVDNGGTLDLFEFDRLIGDISSAASRGTT